MKSREVPKMITPKKLPNGRYSAQVRIGGKRIRLYGDSRNEVMEQYFKLSGTASDDVSVTLDDAMTRYIAASSSLSPTTIREYKKMHRTRYDLLKGKKISLITSEDVRLMVSRWVKDGLSAKTIKNAYSFFLSSVKFFKPDVAYLVTLPSQTKAAKKQSDRIPTADDVRTLLRFAEGKSCEVPIMLAAYCGMRLGEISGIKNEDIDGNKLHICRSIARNADGQLVEKYPKTSAGNRIIVIPDFIFAKLDPDKIITPGGIEISYQRTIKKSGLERFKFHSLRHFYASWMHLEGYADKYIAKLGGWEDVTTLQRIYQHALTDATEGIMEESASKASKLYCDKV